MPTLSARFADPGVELLSFLDSETLRALEAITKRHPGVVALERTFAATPRGAALINRIKADPSLRTCELRIVSPDSPETPAAAAPEKSAAEVPRATSAPVLDQRGTRRADRFKIDGSGAVVIEGKSATLLDLSNLGAQVILPSVLRPNQKVQMLLSDDKGVVRFSATIVWASFEIPTKGDPRYRVGIEFIDADPGAVEDFCHRHKTKN
jgi:hypothetical protein